MGLITSTNYCVNIYFCHSHKARNFFIEILLKCILHSIVLDQTPVRSTLWVYSTSWKSFV